MEIQNKSFNFDSILEKSFEIYKKIALPAGMGIMMLTFGLLILGSIALGFLENDPQKIAEKMKTFNPDTLNIQSLIYFAVIIVVSTLIAPFIAGILKMAQQADQEEDVKFTSLFHYINSDKYIHLIMATFTLTLTGLLVDFGCKQIMPGSLGNSIGFVLSSTISLLTFLTNSFILFSDLGFIAAISASIQKTKTHFFSILVLLIVGILFYILGLFALCIGVFFTLPFLYAMQYVIYTRLK